MPISNDDLLRLLTAIENDTLVVLCGAGASMAPPSTVPNARQVAESCYDRRNLLEDLPAALRQNIDQLATYFYDKGQFSTVFIPLVPWHEMLGESNDAHACIADFTITRAVHASVTTNFDPLIERWAQGRKADLRGALNGHDALHQVARHSPFLKIHGCMNLNREETIWTHAQLADVAVQQRIASCANWLNLLLPGKDLLVVGFWSDWDYLNDVLENALTVNNARSVTVVDIATVPELQVKAPTLWAKLTSLSDVFIHVQEFGHVALRQLHVAHSKVWARKFYSFGTALLNPPAGTPAAVANADALDRDELYALRQDVEGMPYHKAATQKSPGVTATQCACTHLMLLDAGATKSGHWFSLHGNSIRVVNGAGQSLAAMRKRYTEPPTLTQPDIVICAGAEDLALPSHLMSPGSAASTVRPAGGGTSRWLTLDQARHALGV